MSLPNLHPAVVHFPVALFIGALAFDLVCLWARRVKWPDPAAAGLYVLAALGAGAAYLSGRAAEDSLVGVSSTVSPLIAEHADWASWTLWSFATVAAVRAAIAWSDRHAPGRGLIVARAAVLAAALAGAWILFETADHGGALVYRHSVAVAEPAKASPEPEEPAEEISGTVAHALEGKFGDVQVEARVDPSGFEGAIRIAHHVLGPTSTGYFEVTTAGKASLFSASESARAIHDEATVALPGGLLTLTLSSAGSHLKGMVDGKVVVHGHAEPGPPGKAALLFEGRGTVRVLSLVVTPLTRK